MHPIVDSTRRADLGRIASLAGLVLAVSACDGGFGRSPAEEVANHWEILDQYCTECHNSSEFAGGVAFDRVTPENVAAAPETWEHVVRKLRGDLMPPPGGPRSPWPTASPPPRLPTWWSSWTRVGSSRSVTTVTSSTRVGSTPVCTPPGPPSAPAERHADDRQPGIHPGLAE